MAALAGTRDDAAMGRLFIGGAWRDGAGGASVEVRDPSTGTAFGRVAVATADDAAAAVEAADGVAERWGRTPGHDRAKLLRGIADRLEAAGEPMAALIAQEVGKPIVDARVEVGRAVSVFRLAADEIRHLTGETFPADAYAYPPGNERRLLYSTRDPIGVVVAIGPFNFPLNLLAHKVAPALAAGDPVVVKPASAAPLTAIELVRTVEAAGAPPGVINLVAGPGGSVGDALVDHPATRLVTFTGSTAVGTAIAARAGRQAKRVILEMGGLDPMVVLEDAPLESTVAAAARGAFAFAGQVCTASKRIVVAEAIADRFAERLAATARGLRLGPASAETTQVGPVIAPESLERLDRLIADATGRSAKVLAGGDRAAELAPGWFYRPTVLDAVPADAAIALEEPFGPVAPILRVEGIEEAIAVANGTSYGLQASIFTRDMGRAFEFARRVRAGGVHINDPTTLRWDALPFGGVRSSGLGREGVAYAMREMTELKLVSVNYGPTGP